MASPTAEDIAKWPEPNYDNPVSRSPIVYGLVAPTMVLVVAFTAIRFYGRGVLRSALGIDDWTMLVAAICSLPVSAICLASVPLGLGLHVWDQKEEWEVPYNKMAFAADILFPIAVSVTKISLCFTYLRLFPSKVDKIFSYTMSVFVTLYMVACIFLMLFQCSPIRGYWDPSVRQSCINMRATLVSIAALNSFSDFLVYLWPAKPLWTLQLPLKQRLGLVLIFSIGCTVCVAGICRMYYLEVYFGSYDHLWDASVVYALICLEMNLGIICGCLSGVKPVMAVLFPTLFSSSYKSNSRPQYPTYGRTTNPESFAFQPLSDVSNLSKNRDKKFEHGVSIQAINPENTQQRSYAWASSGGDAPSSTTVPQNAIAVDQVVSVHGEPKDIEGASSSKSGKGDNGSEEWIMEEFPQPAKAR